MKVMVSPHTSSARSISGWPMAGLGGLGDGLGSTLPAASLTTWARIESRPTRASISFTEPYRAEARDADLRGQGAIGAVELRGQSSNGTSTLSFTRVGLNCSTVLFTHRVLLGLRRICFRAS